MTDNQPQTPPVGKKRGRGIYLLPNLFTTAGLFAGFYAIVAAMSGRFEVAAVAIFIAMIMDGLDGRVARLTNTQTDFGMEYDSLSDMVCFGLAPSLILFEWSIGGALDKSWVWYRLAWIAAFIYTAGAAIRLARFNTSADTNDKHYFTGLPSPSAAAILAGFIWVCVDLGINGNDMWMVAAILSTLMGGLMVSNVRYYSFKEVDFKNRVPFFSVFLIVLLFVVISTDPPTVLFGLFVVYVASGPALLSVRKFKQWRGGSEEGK